MSPQAQRLVIGETCGRTSPFNHLPDYPHDLNAMHEAEKTLTEDQRLDYRRALCGVVGGSRTNLKSFEQITATAAQRAEAFLRTIGKWDDSK